MAYDAGCDVINLSLGETNAWSVTTDAEAEVVNKIVAKGVSGKFIQSTRALSNAMVKLTRSF
jgi:hypothetical protein